MVYIDTNYPESACLLRHMGERIKKRKGMIVLFTGGVGDGKSYAGLRLLELWYKKCFDQRFPPIHICENLEQAVLLVQKFERPGEGILIEELSVLAGVRDSLSNVNKLWNKFIDMCRIKQAIIVANCPHINFIDIHFVMMCQAWVNCVEVQFKKKIVVARPLWIQASPHKSDPYKHKYISPETYNELPFCYFRLPEDKELVKFYDGLKTKSFDFLSEEIVARMQKNRLQKMTELGDKFLPKREREAYELYLKGYTNKEGAKKMGITVGAYNQNLCRSRERMKLPDYRRETERLNENTTKIPQKSLAPAHN